MESEKLNKKDILYSKGKNNECYTPQYGVLPIIKYLPKNKIIWCPFDEAHSQFVIELKRAGLDVVYSHINYGQDFYTYQPEKWDILVSNPPYTNKKAIFQRALSFNKPFAMLMTITWLNDSTPKKIFMEEKKDLQLLMFDKRIEYRNLDKEVLKKITFSSAYYCYNLLPKQLIMEKLEKV